MSAKESKQPLKEGLVPPQGARRVHGIAKQLPNDERLGYVPPQDAKPIQKPRPPSAPAKKE